MKKIFTAPRVFTGVLLLFLVMVMVAVMIIPSLSFFEVVFDRLGINSAKVELIFDRLNFDNTAITSLADENGNALFVESDEWGTERNPYVISEKYHVQNLSVLQNNGFFKETRTAQSFFLVCTSDGLPVAIDCEGMELAPIGTHDNPFTGVVKGAPLDGDAKYKSNKTTTNGYGVSVSTIGNLVVKASEHEPDIGFFGYVGYSGTVVMGDNNEVVQINNGYAAVVENLLLADVTISSDVTLFGLLDDWWDDFTKIFKDEDGEDQEVEHAHSDEHQDSHHIGVVAGHVEFATVNNISVFYSPNVATFLLDSDDSNSIVNYYTTTGLIGKLHFMNPSVQGGDTLVGEGSGVSDGEMVEGGLGGGGPISGTLTGYMLAQNLYDEHESCVTEVNEDGIYDVKDMKKHDENGNIKDLFESVVMEEGANKTPVTYRFFKDTVFTFAMSTCSQSGPEAVDYVCRIWPEDENGDATAESISGTTNKNDWVYTEDPSAKTRYGYRLERVTSESELNGSGGYFVIAYHDKGENPDIHEDDKLYLVTINTDLEDGEVDKQPFSAFYTFTDPDNENNNITTEWDVNGEFGDFSDIKSVTLIGYNSTVYDNAFKNTASKTISAISGSNALALEAKADIQDVFGFTKVWTYAVPQVSVTDKDVHTNGDASSGKDAIAYNWQFKLDEETDKFAIYQKYKFWGNSANIFGQTILGYNRRGVVALRFDGEKITFDYSRSERVETGNTDDYADNFQAADYNFVIFRVTPNTSGENGINSDAGNVKLDPMSMKPKDSASVKYNFDPSKYVFQNEIGTDGKPTGNYTLAPISSYNLNTGKGTRLDQLNHIVKLYAATKSNYQMKLGSNLNDLFGVDWFEDTNNGGVLGTQIGVGKDAPFYTIPMGMIAFNITKASETDPSYINIIVAINPEQRAAGTIGLWQTENNSNFFNQTFDLSNPDQYFTLPKSVLAYNQDYRDDYTVAVSGYTQQNADGSYSVTNGNLTYVYLNGAIAFVYHSFKVTDPGIYLLGSKTGPMSVAYFSVSGAAGTGADGTSASPLGDIDFVYAYDGNIISVNEKFTGVQDVNNENYTMYYPTYNFVTMIPQYSGTGDNATLLLIQREDVYVYRYIADATKGVAPPNTSLSMSDSTGTKRHLYIYGTTSYTGVKTLADMYGDDLDGLKPKPKS